MARQHVQMDRRHCLPTRWSFRLHHGDAIRMECGFDGACDSHCGPERRASCLVVEVGNVFDLRFGGRDHMVSVA